jgi:hypothetical protein
VGEKAIKIADIRPHFLLVIFLMEKKAIGIRSVCNNE